MDVIVFVEFFAARDLLRLVNIERAIIFQDLFDQWNTFQVEVVVLTVSVEEVRNERHHSRELVFVERAKYLMQDQSIQYLQHSKCRTEIIFTPKLCAHEPAIFPWTDIFGERILRKVLHLERHSSVVFPTMLIPSFNVWQIFQDFQTFFLMCHFRQKHSSVCYRVEIFLYTFCFVRSFETSLSQRVFVSP